MISNFSDADYLVLFGADLDITKRPQVSSCDRTAALLACLQDVHESC
jgi:hypothetical protein